MKIWQFKYNSNEYKRFIFPKDEMLDSSDGIEIIINLESKEFVAKKINVMELRLGDDWVLYQENTFPSSLFREFLNSL